MSEHLERARAALRCELAELHASVERLTMALALLDGEPATPASSTATPAPAPTSASLRSAQRSPRTPRYDRGEAVQIAESAEASGRSPARAVAEHYGISYDAAKLRLRRARSTTGTIPADDPPSSPPDEAQPDPDPRLRWSVDDARELIAQSG